MRTSLFELGDHEILGRNCCHGTLLHYHEILRRDGFRARVLIYSGIKPKASEFFGNRSFDIFNEFGNFFHHPFMGEDAPRKYGNFGCFFVIGTERKRKKAEYCEKGCYESNGSPLKQKISVEMFAMDNAQKMALEWMCQRGALELQH
ncbi:hypothetical protein TNCT_398381 [Trichonephila clavata]|uniref:Uncharacterized protein n=1 Tax=Trichonephila clavata TaxID=2740835 RepID=A0A8X6JZ86_TRICU|nr:hypothetical protein TNCT_398381 [Trichonephila clavata]